MSSIHRVFCATAWELEGERRGFYTVIAGFNEAQAMSRGVLYAPVSLTNVRDKRPLQYVIEENIRDCRHYILALDADWGPVERNFERDYRLAVACAADVSLPTADVTVMLRNGPDGQAPQFASELARAGISSLAFSGVADFQQQVARQLSGWLDADAPAPARSQPAFGA